MKTEKWHYDGHGINDVLGNRLLKTQIARMSVETQGVNPEFDRISILAAAAPNMLEALKAMLTAWDLDAIESVRMRGDAIGLIRAAIAKAEGK